MLFRSTPIGATLWLLAVALEFVAFLLGGINFTVTTMNSRAPGMKMYDIPLVIWMIVLASVIFMASVGPLIAGATAEGVCLLEFTERRMLEAQFDTLRKRFGCAVVVTVASGSIGFEERWDYVEVPSVVTGPERLRVIICSR